MANVRGLIKQGGAEKQMIDIKALSDAEVWRLVQMPNYRDLPPEIIELKKQAQAEFDRRDIKLHFIISAFPSK